MSTPYLKILIIILAVSALAAGGFYVWKGDLAAKPPSEKAPPPSSTASLGDYYENKELGFSLTLPEGYKAAPQEYAEGMKAVVFGKSGGSGKEEFQIFAYPYDEPGPVSPERIWIDEPNMVVDNPQVVKIAGEEALVFFGKDESLGRTREVWIVRGGRLYQISSYAEFDEELSKIMASFRFNMI